MDVAVRTGTTKAPRDVSLVSLQLESLQGEAVCLLMEISAHEKQSHDIERECETIVKHSLLEVEGDAAERLDGALKELNGLLKGMIVSGAIHDAHIIVSILDRNDTLHVSHAGRAEAYLIRHGSASQITEYTPGKATPAFVHIASGGLEAGDLVILSTQRLLRALTPAQLARLTSNRDAVLESVTRALESEGEHAALATMMTAGPRMEESEEDEFDEPVRPVRSGRNPILDRRQRMQSSSIASRLKKIPSGIRLPSMESVKGLLGFLPSRQQLGNAGRGATKRGPSERLGRAGASSVASIKKFGGSIKHATEVFIADLRHPERKKRAHLLLLAGAVATVLVVWLVVHLFTSSQRSKTRAELEALVEQIGTEIQTAQNRAIAGDTDSANKILARAEERAKQVMDNESGLFRVEANELLGRIRSKEEEINNIIRLAPRVSANLAANNPDILARGLIGVDEGEFLVYDKQDAYRVLLNSVESPNRLSEDVLVIDGANMPRNQSQVFLMNGNSVVEWQGGQAVSMKTDDANGWRTGVAADAYLRFLYVLSPDSKQIFKYERLNNRYGAPVEYNVNGDLTGAIDMSIDGNVYILKEDDKGRSILKLFRGETQQFVIRKAPENLLSGVTKIFKIADRNMYLLDPEENRVIIVSDGGPTGEANYTKQYVIEGENVGALQDLYVNSDESQLFVMDEKRIYVIDLTAR